MSTLFHNVKNETIYTKYTLWMKVGFWLLCVVIVYMATGQDSTYLFNVTPNIFEIEGEVFTLDGDLFSSYTKITASDSDMEDRFGVSVAISGKVAVVGAPRDDEKGTDAGAVYVFNRSGSKWIQVQKLTASDGQADDQFGRAVAISGKTIVIGAYWDDDKGFNSGSAYVFQKNRTGWVQAAKLTAFDGSTSDRFGWAVDISGSTIVAGAYQDDEACPGDLGCNSGSAYIFEKDQGGVNQWGLVKKLLASDALEADVFGRALAIDGDTLVIGAQACDQCIGGSDSVPGKAYVFERNQGGINNWGESKILLASDADLGDDFSQSVDIHADTIVVGASSTDDFGSASGSAYIYMRDWGGVNEWGEVKKILPSDSQTGDNFGWDVAILGDSIVAGAFLDDDAGFDAGSIYLFNRNSGGMNNWGQIQKHINPDGASEDHFGGDVAITNGYILAGTPLDDESNLNAGASYLYPMGGRP